jgi:lantibiotic modifying enzyme
MTPARTAAWQPVLCGEEAASARRAVAEIAAALASDRGPPGHDLAGGAAGAALLFGYLARVTGDAGHRAAALALVDRAADHLACVPTGPSLFHGFPGVAWAADHLRSLLGEVDPSCNDDIDDAVATALGCAAGVLGFDLVTGVVGLGVYALERAGRPIADRCAARVVAQLAATARRVPGGVVWTAPDRPDRIDLGLAHGIPGVIALLARCACPEAGPCSRDTAATARGLLDGAVAWLLAQRDPDARFPPVIVGDRPRPPGRAGWCYGDAAVALALVHASRAGDPAWFDAGLEIARTAAARPACETGVRDAGLCHGAAALGLIYQRLHHATGDPALHAAARDWVLRILARRSGRDEPAITAGWSQATTGAPCAVPGLMNGAAGIGLVLLAASSEVAPDWDRALLLSGDQTPHAAAHATAP